MDLDEAHAFAQTWLRAWNAHDVDAVLSHFAEDALFTSPVAAQLLPETDGRLQGKEAIRSYWSRGLERIPELHFELENVYLGLDTVVIHYRNHVGNLVNEVLHFDDAGLVNHGAGTYLAADAAAASGTQG